MGSSGANPFKYELYVPRTQKLAVVPGNDPTFTTKKAKRITGAFRYLHNHRQHVLEEEQLPEHRRDHIPKSGGKRIDLGTKHGVVIYLSANCDELEVKIDVENLKRSRRENDLEDVSLFFESLVETIRRGADRHLNGVDEDIVPTLSFQGRDIDAFYCCNVTAPAQ